MKQRRKLLLLLKTGTLRMRCLCHKGLNWYAEADYCEAVEREKKNSMFENYIFPDSQEMYNLYEVLEELLSKGDYPMGLGEGI
ncbi:MAG: hypothetical protein ACLUD2_15510 [Clostridium sp.]